MTYAVSQDVVLTVPPYSYLVGEPSNVPLEKCWMVRTQMFFGTQGAAGLPRRQRPVAEWNEDIPRISLIQIYVIEIG